MPNPGKTMIVRPRNCTYCEHGYYALAHVKSHAQAMGWNVIDISAGQATKDPVLAAIDLEDPGSFYGFGHGNDCRYTGDTEEDIFNCNENERLAGRDVYLLSCLTANGLGPSIIENGATSYAGFDISWTWLAEGEPTGDPYMDWYAKGFWESANELWVAYLEGEAFIATIQRSIDMYNAWIDYWYDHPEDPSSDDCIMWLIFDRDGLVGITQEGTITQPGKLSISVTIPLLVLLGAMAYIAVKK